MNLGLIPLLLVALIMATTEARVDSAEILLDGRHEITDHRGALIVGDATVTIPDGERVPGPIYVIGGELVVAGTVESDVVQLAGTVTVPAGGTITGELRLIGGTRRIDPASEIGRQSRLDVAGSESRGGFRFVPLLITATVLALVGAQLARRRPSALGNISGAIGDHPVICLTVGILLFLTAIALIVFMAFTLILIPVAIVGIVAGLLTVGYGVIAWGHLLGRRLPVARPSPATALGVVMVILILQVVTLVPVVGDLVTIGALLLALGAVVITYYGVITFRPAPLPD